MSLFAFDKLSGEVSLIDHPMNGSVPASATQLMELLAQSPYADCEILDANIAALFNPSKSNQSRVVARAVNARLNVNIDEPLMMAEGELICARGGEILDLDNAVRQLREAGIKKGISRKALELLLAKQFELPPGGVPRQLLLLGVKPKVVKMHVLFVYAPPLKTAFYVRKKLKMARWICATLAILLR